MSREGLINSDCSRIWLIYIANTSGLFHLSPNLYPNPTLSVVGTCCNAKGLIVAIVFLNAAE